MPAPVASGWSGRRAGFAPAGKRRLVTAHVAWCHCQSCRKHSGAPVSVFAAFERAAYTVTQGEITKFNSSPKTRRGFCARCGSTLTCESERLPTETHFHVGAFDRAAQLQPTRHIFPEERLSWLHLADA